LKFKEKINFDKTYYYMSILFAFVLPLSRAAISFFVILFILVWIFEGNYKKKLKQIWENKILKSIFYFLVFVLISLLWTENIETGLNVVRMYWGYWAVIFIAATSLHYKYITSIITAFLAGLIVSCIISYGVYFNVFDFKNNSISPFMITIEYSVFLAVASMFLLNKLFENKCTNNKKIMYIFLFIFLLGVLFLSNGRTGQLGFFVALFILPLLHFKVNFKSIFISFFLVVTIFTLAYNTSNSFKSKVDNLVNDVNKVNSSVNYSSSTGIRLAYGIVTYDIFLRHPFIGSGAGDYRNEVKKSLENEKFNYLDNIKYFLSNHHPHNQYYMFLIQFGLIGLILFLNIVYSVIKTENRDNEFTKFKILFIVIYLASFVGEPLFHKQFTAVLFVLFVSLISIKQNSLEKI